MRGAACSEGWHDYKIRTGGIVVFPILIAAEHGSPSSASRCRLALGKSMRCSTEGRFEAGTGEVWRNTRDYRRRFPTKHNLQRSRVGPAMHS
jgi:hypothetical protein